jgi:hypothetical protein
MAALEARYPQQRPDVIGSLVQPFIELVLMI